MNKHNIYTPRTDRKMSVAVLLSGSGTNFEALYKRQLELEKLDQSLSSIDLVFSNVPDCLGIQKAEQEGLRTASLSSKNFFKSIGRPADDDESREKFDLEVINLIESHCIPDLIVLAGYRRKLSGAFYGRFINRIINMYPGDITLSYLKRNIPAYVQALENGDEEIKCTVYLDRQNERFGPAIAQSPPVYLDGYNFDNKDDLETEIRETAEWKTFPFVIQELIANGRIKLDNKDNIYLDDKILPQNGYQL